MSATNASYLELWSIGREASVARENKRYVREHLSLQRPLEMIFMTGYNNSHIEAFLLIDVPAKKSGDVAKRLVAEQRQYVTEAHGVWGESDVLARVSVPNHAVLADLVMDKIQRMTFVRGTRTFITIEGMRHRAPIGNNAAASKIEGFVFINVEASRSDDIARFLIDKYPESVKEAHAVWGGADVIARITCGTMSDLAELVLSSIQSIDYVSVTRTYLIISGMSELNRDIKQISGATGNVVARDA